MADPRASHPLDVDLVDLVDGVLDAAGAEAVESHLATCPTCRTKRYRIARTAPIDVAVALRGGVEAPAFDPIEVEDADPSAVGPGELWLTAADDAAMVLVTEVRPTGRGVTVVPVVLDVEIADHGTLVLDRTASPLAVPIAIYDDMPISLPMTALRGRVAPVRPEVDLLALSDADPGVGRGTLLDGPADPRHEVRQSIADQVTPAEPWSDQDVFDERFEELRRAFFGRDDAVVRPLRLPGDAPGTWEGIAQIESFDQRVLVLAIEGGLPEDRGPVTALCEQLHGSAIAVRADARSPEVDLYLRSNLVGARSVRTGAILSGPILTGPEADTIVRYLDAMVSIPSVSALAAGRRAPVDPKEILGRQVDAALARQVATGRNARIPAKREGLTSVEDLGPGLTEALGMVFSKLVTPSAIIDLVDGDDR